ncbi:hypothetical protein HPP92_023976 [Vanilla planifolia]|uniref:Hyaluronan/mRNA-binding protein domain-containing protein n=1 Tax=Vanilla planifolia TaxID=51239 RepID=A0A835PK19_VANPL|nr:hypothetical protein HPP92_023976 [Vanilla planifolia]
MASANPFDILGNSENDDPSVLIAAQELKIAAKKPAKDASSPSPAKLPSKPLPPAQAVRETRNSAATARDGRGGTGRGRGGRGVGIGQNRDFGDGNNGRYGAEGGRGGGYRSGSAPEDGDMGKPLEKGSVGQQRGPLRGGRRGGYVNDNTEGGLNSDHPQRRAYDRRSGTGRGNEMKRDGAGRGNWGTVTDDVLAQETEEGLNVEEKAVILEKNVNQEDGKVTEAGKDKGETANEAVEKEPEDNEMTLEEYEKIREEKRKALLAMKVEERKVEVDKDLQTMQQLTIKKGVDDVFIKLGSDKDLSKRRDGAEKDDRAKKAMSINDFLKPAEGGRSYGSGGRGRGRGRGSFQAGYNGGSAALPATPSIEDQGQFPTLGGK